MKNIIKSYFGNKRGMTLVEVLTAMAILSLLIFCFSPLFLTYFSAIKVAGEEIKDVQMQSGVLQTVIGNYDAGKGGNYSANVTDIALELSTPTTANLSRENNNGVTINTLMNGKVTVAIGNQLDEVKGDFLVSNPTDLGNGYTTIKAQGTASGLVCYPKTLTDDFVTAKIIVYGSGGITFNEASYASDFKLTCGLNGATQLANGTDYTVRRLAGSMVEFTIYGGGKISFETSPLNINFRNGQHILQVEVDSPTMIMVGEADNSGEYYYYVSRGEMVDGADADTDEDELAIIRRKMYTTKDPKDSTISTTNPIGLTSAMNDVEWVPADSGDGYNVDSNGKKYGYYVMCGDNGQVRRFWRNNETGNYYWGGDYTYYTDYNFVQVNDGGAAAYVNSTDKKGNASTSKVYSTDTSFKFIAQRDMTNTQSGFNVGSKEYSVIGSLINTSTILLRSLSVVSVTKSDDAEFYGADGRVVMYKLKKNGSSVYPTYNESLSMSSGSKWQGIEIDDKPNLVSRYNDNEVFGWLETNTNSYYQINGIDPDSVNKDSYPITLTSVDAIRITGSGAAHKTSVTASSEGSYYWTNTGDGDTSAEGATTNMNYPQSSYTLYCGYIPAVMDLFASRTGSTGSYRYPTGWKGTYGHSDDGTWHAVGGSYIKRAANRPTLQSNAEYYSYWRMTLGLTPYYKDGSNTVAISTAKGELAYDNNYKEGGVLGIGGTKKYEYLVYWPYTNLDYAITGKFYDNYTFTNHKSKIQSAFGVNGSGPALTVGSPNHLINVYDGVQSNVTNGEVVDVTVSYLSHPFAIAIAANPTDDVVYDLANNKDGGQIFYWNNRRETITFLDSASTVIPNGENDIPVSLMVGYVTGGTVEYGDSGSDAYANVGSVMNNGIVFLRSGNYYIAKQNSANSQTYEYLATDDGGYKLDMESNVFHQFYYLNSRTAIGKSNGNHGEYTEEPSKGGHIGNLYGADYWQNNRHIQYKSLTGAAATNGSDGSYEYLRSHPMSNTKVTCVKWGVTWQGYPEAMWGTENGTVISWWVNTTEAKSTDKSKETKWNDRGVDAEFQSYKWVDNVNGKTFGLSSSQWKDTVGSAVFGSTSTAGTSYSLGSGKIPDTFKYFADKTSQETGLWSTIGFISTLETINDIEYANDYWVAVGDQSNKAPADYCSNGTYYGGGETAKAYSDNGRGGSWVNVRYWVDTNGSGKQSDSNAYYHWRAVKISQNENYNIVQINNVNGIWVATGYEDSNNNEEYDSGERTVICWARNPLAPCTSSMDGKWSEEVQFYANDGASMTLLDQNKVGGINSCATRTE